MATSQITSTTAPPQVLYLTLGSGESTEMGVGSKAALLDRAADTGLRVPQGYILLDHVWTLGVQHGYLDVQDEQVVCSDPTAFYEALGLPTFDGAPVIVRSAFDIEDKPSLSMAGHFASVAGIEPSSAEDMVGALCDVWSSSLEYDNIRRDILVMQLVEAEFAGVAFTEAAYEDDRVNYTEGTAEKLLSGEEEGESLSLRRLRQYEKGEREEGTPRADATWQDRVQVLLRRVRGTFGEGSWDIEWADDGTFTYLLQVRPVTAPVRRNEAFTRANHKEILPDLPSTYMTDLIASVSQDLYDWYRQFDDDLPAQRPFIEVFKGRPYINLSLMTETMRALGLPTQLVTDNIGGDETNADGFRLRRAIAKLPSLARLGVSQLNAVDSAQNTAKELQSRTQHPGHTFNELNETFRWAYTALVTEMFNLTQAMSLPLSRLRRSGKLADMAAATRSVATKMYDDLAPLRAYVREHDAVLPALKKGELPDDPEFKRMFGLYLAKYGHRGIYESDIARPRYEEVPSPLLVALTSDAVIPEPHTTSADDLGPVASQARKLIIAREQLRHDAMRAFMSIRKRLLALADKAVEAGQLPHRDAVFDLTLKETALLDVGWNPGEDFFKSRMEEFEALRGYDMPDLLHRFDDLDELAPDFDPAATRLKGMGLVAGEVTGTAWVLTEPETALPEGYDPATTILIARSAESGWIPTFTKVAGVVVETGGDLSHGSIILRELGLPSATNVKTASRVFQTGDTITLNGSTGVVKKADA